LDSVDAIFAAAGTGTSVGLNVGSGKTITLAGTAKFSGSTSGTTTLQATAVAGTTTLTLPAATDTLVGKATTDTLTNKTLTGAVMNGTLGATTPSTVAATSITASTTLSVTGVSTFSAGSAAAPALTTTGDTNTGIFFPAADIIASSTGGTERARFTASGYLKASNTGSYADATGLYHELNNNDVATSSVTCRSTNGSFTGNVFTVQCDRNTTGGSYNFISCGVPGVGVRFQILDSGNAQNINNSYGAISDVKLKENIVDASPKLADLMQVKVRNYNLIGHTTKQIGVVAQELKTVFPAMVDESPDRDEVGNDLGTTTKSVKYSVFVPMLIKAMQEQQALITQLTARITALEGA
jgi:hypothetical protein